MSGADVFASILSALDAAKVPAMLTGSFAAGVYGRVRATRDIDFVIDADEPRARLLVAALVARGYYADEDAAVDAVRTHTQFNAIDPETGWKIGFILRKSRAFSREEFDRRRPVDLDGTRIDVASVEDTVIAKLEWAKLGDSERQIEDVIGILRVQLDAIDRDYIERWVESLGLQAQWTRAMESVAAD
jgi:hypothetical protein